MRRVVALLLMLPATMLACMELKAAEWDEVDLLRWSRTTTDEGSSFAETFWLRVVSVEYTGKSLLLGRCPRQKWSPVERYLNPGFRAVAEEALTNLQNGDETAGGGLRDNWEVSLVYSFRSWSRAQQLSWLGFIQTSESGAGANWWRRTWALRRFDDHFIDINTGMNNPVWPYWVAQLLGQNSSLSGAFDKTLDALQPNLGKEFRRAVSRPIKGALSDQERANLTSIGDRMHKVWDDIPPRLGQYLDQHDREAARYWVQNSLTGDLAANYEDANAAYLRGKGSSQMTKFLSDIGRGKAAYEARHDAYFKQMVDQAPQNCGKL